VGCINSKKKKWPSIVKLTNYEWAFLEKDMNLNGRFVVPTKYRPISATYRGLH